MKKPRFHPFLILSSARLRLRRLTHSDETDLFALRTDEQVNRYLGRPAPQTPAEVQTFIATIDGGIEQDRWIYWAISLRDRPELIGTICLWNFSDDQQTAELGYELLPNYQGRGLMSEALQMVLDFAWNRLRLAALEAYTHPKNQSSTRLLQKYGFTSAGAVQQDSSAELIFRLTRFR